MQLFFKRAKIFMLNQNGVSLRYVGMVNAAGTADARVPDWVRETETYKAGVADKSIVDLTPPKQRETKKHKALGHDPLEDVAAAPVAVLAAEEEPEHKPFGNPLPQKTPKGFSNQPTASGRRVR
jgi:hypothetical protein